MTRGIFVSLAVAAGLLIAINTGSTQAAAAVATSPAHAVSNSLVQKAGDFEYCYWKLKKNGKWKFKCED